MIFKHSYDKTSRLSRESILILISTQSQEIMQETNAKSVIHQKFITKWLRVVTKNQRIFEGKLMCVDYKGNLILHEAVAQVPPTQNCPLNYDLQNLYDQKLKYTPPTGLSQEQATLHRREYFGTHYYFGSIMISGGDIVSIEMANDSPAEQQQKNVSEKA